MKAPLSPRLRWASLPLLFLMVTPLACLGCDDAVDSPTAPTTTAPAPILFSGTMQPGSTRFYSYTLTTAGTVTAMLASLERNGLPAGNALELGVGVPAGTGCAVESPLTATPSLTPQIRLDAAIGTYCVRLADRAGLPSAMNFTIKLVRP